MLLSQVEGGLEVILTEITNNVQHIFGKIEKRNEKTSMFEGKSQSARI